MADINLAHESEAKYQDFDSFDVDSKKERLKRSSERLKTVIDAQVDELKQDAAAWAKAITVVGGGVYFTYKILKFAFKSARKSRSEKRLISKIAKSSRTQPNNYRRALPVLTKNDSGWSLNSFIRHQLMLLVIAIAKRRVMALLSKN